MPIPNTETVTQFIDSMVTNLQCLGEEADPGILLLPGFCRLHKVGHSEFECSVCQEAVARVLTQMMENKSKKTSTYELMESQNSVNSSNLIKKTEEENENLNMSYSDTSSDGGGLSSPPPVMIKVQRRRRFVKGKGWTSIVIHPEPKVEEIKALIGEIQDQQDKHTLPLSTNCEEELSNPTQGKLQWVPKKQSFKAQVKES